MPQDDLALLFDRELASLDAEVQACPTDATLLAEVPGPPNRVGTLVLHLCGNLRHFIGTVLGQSGFVRDRDAEFARRDVPRAVLREEIALARRDVAAALAGLGEAALDAPYPIAVGKDVRTTMRRFLLHLLSHCAYHLGQIDYARRAVTGDPASAGVQPLAALQTRD